MHTLTSPTDSRNLIGEKVKDLRDLNATQQTEFLLNAEKLSRLTNVIDHKLYLLRGKAHEVLNGLSDVTVGLHDIDGTHTTVGGHSLFPQSIQGLKRMGETGITNIAVTGRHLWQVEEVIDSHPDGTGFGDADWLIEQGFYRRSGKGKTEYFEGTPAIENRVGMVRERIEPLLRELEALFGVRFETTSLRNGNAELYPHAHKTMYSVDAHRGNVKIGLGDEALHEAILATLEKEWKAHDPSGATAKLGTSSIGTYEFTPDGLNKEGSVRLLMNGKGVAAHHAIYLGDSGNDVPVFQNINGLRTAAVVNPHTKESLIGHADIAAVGIGNAQPIMEEVIRARKEMSRISL